MHPKLDPEVDLPRFLDVLDRHGVGVENEKFLENPLSLRHVGPSDWTRPWSLKKKSKEKNKKKLKGKFFKNKMEKRTEQQRLQEAEKLRQEKREKVFLREQSFPAVIRGWEED